jgi:hypothetical protein
MFGPECSVPETLSTNITPYPFVVIDKFTSALWSGHESEPLAMKQFTTGFSYLIEVVFPESNHMTTSKKQ